MNAIVTITYFKESGKFYTEETAQWPMSKENFTGFEKFENVVRIKDMYALCLNSPLGFPQFYIPPNFQTKISDSLHTFAMNEYLRK